MILMQNVDVELRLHDSGQADNGVADSGVKSRNE